MKAEILKEGLALLFKVGKDLPGNTLNGRITLIKEPNEARGLTGDILIWLKPTNTMDPSHYAQVKETIRMSNLQLEIFSEAVNEDEFEKGYKSGTATGANNQNAKDKAWLMRQALGAFTGGDDQKALLLRELSRDLPPADTGKELPSDPATT